MNHKRFDELVGSRLTDCKDTLSSKDKEYSSDDDRLHNFVVAGRMDNESPAKALWGMWKKHIVSIKDIVDRMEKDPDYVPSLETVKEKFGDNINYTLLLEGVVEDRRNKQKKILQPNHIEEVTEFEEVDSEGQDVKYCPICNYSMKMCVCFKGDKNYGKCEY